MGPISVQRVHAGRFDHVPEVGGAEPADDRDRAADLEHGYHRQRRAPVEQRAVDQVLVVRRGGHDAAGAAVVPVGDKHALRRPGRARRVQDRLQVPRLERAFRAWPVVAAGVEQRRRLVERAQAGPQGHVTGPRADHHDVGKRPVVDVVQPLEQRVVRDEDPCPRVAHDPFEQAAAVGRVDRDVDRSPQVDPEPGAQQLRPVRQPAPGPGRRVPPRAAAGWPATRRASSSVCA